MTEKTGKPKKFVLRRLAVTAAVLALAAALAMGANAATGGELYKATIGRLVLSFQLEDGSSARLYQTETDDGKTLYLVEDEHAEITKKDNGDGTYTFPGFSGPYEDSGAEPEGEFYAGFEVETDEDGNVVAAREFSGPNSSDE